MNEGKISPSVQIVSATETMRNCQDESDERNVGMNGPAVVRIVVADYCFIKY